VAPKPKYKRVLLKLSGEALGRGPGEGLDLSVVEPVAREIASVNKDGVEIAVVIGGGNLVRGRELIERGLTPALAHTMGMMATVVNGLALHDLLGNMGVENRLQTAIPMESVAERYIRERCLHHLEKGRVVILAAGTGSPFFTTDTAAALRARELDCDVLLKGTNVDGVYSRDPRKHAKATRYGRMSYEDVLHNNLGVMDATAVTLCRDAGIPIIVFNRATKGNLRRVLFSKRSTVGTYIGRK